MIKILINALTLFRIAVAMIIFSLLTFSNFLFLAFVLFFIAGLTDYLDGFLARKYNASSQIGEILDPIADKSANSIFIFWTCIKFVKQSYWICRRTYYYKRDLGKCFRDFNARINNSDATKVLYIAKIKTTIQLFTISIYLICIGF